MASIRVTKTGAVKQVKNLGAMRARAKDIERIVVTPIRDSHNDARVVAHLYNGERYESEFASVEVLKDFLNRWRSVGGVPVMWFGHPKVAGKL